MFMPLIFIFFCYNFASALALYWTVQNLFSVVQLYVTRNQAPPRLQKVAAPRKEKIAQPFSMSLNREGNTRYDAGLPRLRLRDQGNRSTSTALTLQIYTAEKDRLIGRNGETARGHAVSAQPAAPGEGQGCARACRWISSIGARCGRTRSSHRVRQIAEIVRQTGRPYHLEPMNAYERRIVHNAFKDDPEIMTWSPPDDARLKRITLKKRPTPQT